MDANQACSTQVLDELRTGRLVFYQDVTWVVKSALLQDRMLQVWIIKPSTEHTDQVEAVIACAPGGANAIVVKFATFVAVSQLCRVRVKRLGQVSGAQY